MTCETKEVDKPKKEKAEKPKQKELKCSLCGKQISYDEGGYESRLRRYKDEYDMNHNYVCKTCGLRKKKEIRSLECK